MKIDEMIQRIQKLEDKNRQLISLLKIVIQHLYEQTNETPLWTMEKLLEDLEKE